MKGNEEGIILEGLDSVALEQALKLNFKASNNQVEYKALIVGLKLTKEFRAKKLRCYTDSQIVQLQVAYRYHTKKTILLKYYHIAKTLIDDFKCFEMYYISRERNTRVVLLSKLTNTKKTGHLKTIMQETLQSPTIDIEEVMAGEEEESDWMTLQEFPNSWGIATKLE